MATWPTNYGTYNALLLNIGWSIAVKRAVPEFARYSTAALWCYLQSQLPSCTFTSSNMLKSSLRIWKKDMMHHNHPPHNATLCSTFTFSPPSVNPPSAPNSHRTHTPLVYILPIVSTQLLVPLHLQVYHKTMSKICLLCLFQSRLLWWR